MTRQPGTPKQTSIVWRGVIFPGMEWCRLRHAGAYRVLEGVAILNFDLKPCLLEYLIKADRSWQTREASITGHLGKKEISLNIKVNSRKQWLLNGKDIRSLEGCIDIDLGFSPSTNLLPIRRLGLDIGEKAGVAAAWVEFPSMKLKVLPQSYLRLKKNTYHYESNNGKFKRDLTVSKDGLVTSYPGLWEMEAALG